VHDVFSRRKDHAQDNNEEEIRERRDPIRVNEPESDLQEHSCHGEDRGETKARLGEEEAIPVGLHGPERQGKVGDPEEYARLPEHG